MGKYGKYVGLALGIVMFLAGAVWTFQGLGWIEGSSMSGDDVWATIGPIVAGLGVALAWVSVRGVPK